MKFMTESRNCRYTGTQINDSDDKRPRTTIRGVRRSDAVCYPDNNSDNQDSSLIINNKKKSIEGDEGDNKQTISQHMCIECNFDITHDDSK